jgi:PTS system nitrogen regulatory IIA component
MDLKIKDVIELLGVSETTIRRWLADGKIPAYRINQQYRFSRTEIENWVMSRKIGRNGSSVPFKDTSMGQHAIEQGCQAKGGSKHFGLYRAIHKGGVLYDVPGATKEEVIQNTMKMVATDLALDAEGIAALLLDREALQPTSLSNGIAIPHTRDFLLNAHYDAVTVAFSSQPLQYGALDGKPVDILFFLFACDDKRHLHLLAKIAHLGNNPEILKFLQSRPAKDKLLAYIKDWESSLGSH